MGKKKAGGKNKLARMSEDERARYLQHRADIEEEAKRRKQQLIAMYMKNKLKREDAFTRLNLAKINQEWRFILRQVKCKEMRNEIKIMESLFTDCVERKNRIIRRLLCDLDESEEIYATMLHTHMEQIEKLIQLHDTRLTYFKNVYEKQKKQLLQQHVKEIESYKTEKQRAQRELEAVFYGLEEKADIMENLNEEKHLKNLDDLKNSMSIKLENLTKNREKEMEVLWKEFQIILNNYVRHKDQYRNEYIDLRRRDAAETRNIKNHYQEVNRLTNLIVEQKSHLEIMREDNEFNFKELGKHKNILHDQYQELKKDFEMNLQKDKENFKLICIESERTIKFLKNILKKGESLMQMLQVCHKLETEEEKIVPFGKKGKIMFKYDEDDLREIPEDLGTDNEFLNNKLGNFWKQYNIAKLDCVGLEEEKTSLIAENRMLKGKLKDYLTNVNINTGAGVEITEGQLMQRPSSMKIEKVIHIDLTKAVGGKTPKRRPVTCIDGNLSVAVRTKNLIGNRNKLPQCIPIVLHN